MESQAVAGEVDVAGARRGAGGVDMIGRAVTVAHRAIDADAGAGTVVFAAMKIIQAWC